ncbi:MAG: hypothetical protein ACE5FU_11405 [Nitrospinota bacterium]
MVDLYRGVRTGAFGGAAWGLLTLALSLVFGVTALEGSLVHDLITFIVGGVVFGVITGAMFSVIQSKIPVKSSIVKGIVIAVGVWVILLGGAVGLSFLSPGRYNVHIVEILQGVILVGFLGGIIGFLGRSSR